MNYYSDNLLPSLFLLSVVMTCQSKAEIQPQTANKEEIISETITSPTSENSSYKTLDWDDLLPEDDLEALTNPPEYLSEIEDGSPEDQVNFNIQRPIENELEQQKADRFQLALISTRIIEDLDGKNIKIPGFIVPLEFNDDQVITEFFLVPYFGACIHVPPPPPNQVIYVKYDKGFKLDALYDPFWISGKIKTELIDNDLATAAYTMTAQVLEPYTE